MAFGNVSGVRSSMTMRFLARGERLLNKKSATALTTQAAPAKAATTSNATGAAEDDALEELATMDWEDEE